MINMIHNYQYKKVLGMSLIKMLIKKEFLVKAEAKLIRMMKKCQWKEHKLKELSRIFQENQ